MKILGIESSCDETAAAVIEDGRKICSSVIHTQVEEHKLYGGVVPEIASRRHIESICGVTAEALEQAGLTAREVDAVAVTAAPGLIGAVLVGVNFAKGLALSAEKPLIPVHHIRGHVAANYLAHPELEPPFLALIVSGGHSHIVRVQDYTHFEVLGRTVDDAAGEAFDKVARTLGLSRRPGGEPGRPNGRFQSLSPAHAPCRGPVQRQLLRSENSCAQSCEQSADERRTCERGRYGRQLPVPHHGHSGRKAAAGRAGYRRKGGVAANGLLRETLAAGAKKLGARLYLPELRLCGDNAAMVAAQGFYEYRAGNTAGLNLNGLATLGIDYL